MNPIPRTFFLLSSRGKPTACLGLIEKTCQPAVDKPSALRASRVIECCLDEKGSSGPRHFVPHTHSTRAHTVGAHTSTKTGRVQGRFSHGVRTRCAGMRHCFTTYLLQNKMDRDFVQELRGDARRSAVDIYNHIDPEKLREAYLAAMPQFGL